MIRAAPTRGPLPATLPPEAPDEYSSISTRYGLPPIVTGMAICGIVMFDHTRRLISVTCGFGLRAWTSERSTMISPSRAAR